MQRNKQTQPYTHSQTLNNQSHKGGTCERSQTNRPTLCGDPTGHVSRLPLLFNKQTKNYYWDTKYNSFPAHTNQHRRHTRISMTIVEELFSFCPETLWYLHTSRNSTQHSTLQQWITTTRGRTVVLEEKTKEKQHKPTRSKANANKVRVTVCKTCQFFA